MEEFLLWRGGMHSRVVVHQRRLALLVEAGCQMGLSSSNTNSIGNSLTQWTYMQHLTPSERPTASLL